MRFTLSVLLIFIVAGFGAALIFVDIPGGSKEVVISIMSILSTALVTILNSLLRKPNE